MSTNMISDENLDEAMSDGRTRWQYQVVEIAESQLQDSLNTSGVFGWELSSITPSITHRYFIVIFKRPYWFPQEEPIETDE